MKHIVRWRKRVEVAAVVVNAIEGFAITSSPSICHVMHSVQLPDYCSRMHRVGPPGTMCSGVATGTQSTNTTGRW
jgi:hypothetical protein